MSRKFLNLNGLKESLDSQNPVKAKEIIENICKFFDQDLSAAELALAVEQFFHHQTGTLAFVNKSIQQNKRFTDTNNTIFELWIKLIQNHAKEVNFESYIENIVTLCLRYAVSTVVSAKEKENATIVMQELFENGLARNVDAGPLIIKLLNILNQKQKQSTFLQEVYKLVGIIARDSPSSIMSVTTPSTLRDIFLKPLENSMINNETLQFNALTGALQGLTMFLTNFAPSPAEEPEVCKQIYLCMKRLSDPMDFSKKATFRASLNLFTKHTELFGELIFKDSEYWHGCLEKWLNSVYEDRRIGIYATHAFHQIIGSQISLRGNENDRDTLRFFTNAFRETLESRSSPSFKCRIAIRGFGVMSGPCKTLLPDMLEKLTLLVLQRTELVSIVEDNELRDTLEHFPDYVEALSQIILITDDKQVMEMLMQNVELIMIRLIKDFHYLSKAHTQLVINSLLKAFSNLAKVGGSVLDSVLEKVTLNGIIWTCSHKLVYDANIDWNTNIDWKQNITYRSYFPLWEGLIINVEDIGYDRCIVAKKVFNYIMQSLFVILSKLDLRTRRRVYTDEDGNDKEFYFCDPNIDLCPVKPHDFHIFFNVVDFYKDLFWVKFRSEYFNPWIQEFLTIVLRLATQNPLVSGFLKLLEIGLVKAEFLHYFDNSVLLEVHTLHSHLCHFLEYLITKTQRISGELQISCLELILKYPCNFYENYITKLIPIFEIALDVGKSTIWLAKLVMTVLENMSQLYPEDSKEMTKLYKQILPCLDSYLRSKGFQENLNAEIVKFQNKRRIRKATIPKITETELLGLQKRIVTFLGKLSPQVATMMILHGKTPENLVKWEMEQSLRVILHFPTMRPSIYLDTIMPRVCELALISSDRKTKVSACELVHAVILYLMGIRKYKGQIWKELCRCMLILGSDSDGTVQQMFEPLLKQVMHYMSKYENLEGVDYLMEALMNGISNSGNSSIRDLAAVCLREFIEWSIKQITQEQLAASPGSIKIILENIKMYSFDSESAKRNGASLAFNNLYRILREQESICDIYFVDLFYTFCINFKLSEELSLISIVESLNSDLEQVSLTLDHIVRVLKERNDIFNKPSARRVVPPKQDMKTLKDLVLFCLEESGSKLMKYRHKCIEIVNTLSSKILGVVNIVGFLELYVTPEILRTVCEGPADGTGIKARPNLDFIRNEKNSPYAMIYLWLQHLLSSLECYCWLLDIQALKHKGELFKNANIFQVVCYYLNNVCWENANDILHKIDANLSIGSADTILQINSQELAKIEIIKTLITTRIIEFLTKVLKNGCGKLLPDSYWTDNKEMMKKFFIQLIFKVHKLNFDFRVESQTRKLPMFIVDFINALPDNVDTEFVTELHVAILDSLKSSLIDVYACIEELLQSDSVTEEQINLVNGMHFVCKNLDVFHADTELRSFLKRTVLEMFSDLFLKIKKTTLQKDFAIEPCPSIKKIVNQLMSICLTVNNMSPHVVHFLLDTSLLSTNEANTNVTHGKHFLSVYKSTIFEYCDKGFIENVISQLLQNINASNFHQVLNFLIELVEYLYKTKHVDNLGLRAATETILEKLPIIITFISKKEGLLAFTKLMGHLVSASPYELHSFRSKAPALENVIFNQLSSKETPLKIKSNIIYLLPTLTGPDDEKYQRLTEELESVQRQHIPLRSSEVAKNSSQETELKYLFKYMLDALIVSKSYVILEFLIKCTACDSKHIVDWMIRDALKSYTLLLSVKNQMLQMERVLQMICSRDIEQNSRLIILERFLLIMVRSSHIDSLEEFFKKNIKKIVELIETNYGSGKSGWIVEHALVDRIVGFSLVEIMLACLPKEKLCSKDSAISREFVGELKSGTELAGILTRKAFYSRTEVFVTDDPVARELFRQYQCAAYRAVCSLVCNTQTELRFYSKFIFEENLTKNELVWRKLIDCSNETLYSIESQETEEYLKVKERFVSIRKLNPRPVNSSILPTYSSKQLQTQSVFQSSLSQDVSKLDLNYSNVRTDAEAMMHKERLQGTVATVHLERTTLNKHEVMPILCGVVQHMSENDISPKPPPGAENHRPYKWITAIATALENQENHRNIRLFLAQLVQNCREIFQHYGYALFCPILQVLVDECAGTKLNFFTTDLVAMLLSWTSKNFYTPSTPEERRLISQLLKFLMRNAWHDKREIFKFNLELIQSVIHFWKDYISVPSQLLLDSITKSQASDSRENGCGIILLGLVLNNDLEVWTSSSKEVFIRSIVMNLSNEYTSIYQAASSVLGIMLKKLEIEEDTVLIENRLPELINRIKNMRTKNEKKFLDIIYGIHKNYPEIIDSFREIITFRIPLALGPIKCIYLEMLLARIESYDAEELYKVLISIGIVGIMKNLDYQLLGLHILNRAVRKMNQENVESLMENIEEATESRKEECRDVAYEILIFIALNFPNELGNRAGQFLLNGLMDPSTKIQDRIFHFWSKETSLSPKIDERLLFLISDYSIKCEKQFLGFCTQLLLELSIENAESKRQVFEFQSDDSKLMEYQISTDPQIKSTNSLPPLFAESHNTRRSLLLGSQNFNYVPDTASDDYFFEPTLDPSKTRSLSQSFSLPTQGSLLFIVAPQILGRNSEKIRSQAITEENLDRSFEKLRKRFLKDKEKETRHKALQVIDRRAREKSKMTVDMKKREGKVVLYRRYRNGDYPDLLINHLALLLPLQGLAKQDAVIAREVFVSIFSTVLNDLGPEANMFIVSICTKIQNILQSAKICDPMIFATFLEIALLQPAKFDFTPDLIAMLAKATNMLTIGAIYLENRINADWETDMLSAKSNSTIPIDEQHWLHLSDIYNSLAEYDIVSSIFADKMRTDPRLAEAIDLKANGKFEQAQELLLQVIDRREQLEHYYAYICYYECFLKMGMWSELSLNVQNQIDDFEELWADDYNMAFLLPNLMQSELQMVLEKSPNNNFLRALESWTDDPVKMEHIQRAFCEELMMLNIANHNFLQARVFGECYLKSFLMDWSVTSSMNDKLRMKNLLSAQKVAEIDQYALLLIENFNEGSVAKLNTRWERCAINESESLDFWNSVISYRICIANMIQEMMANMNSEGTTANDQQNVLFKMNMQLFDAAVAQNNYVLSGKILHRLRWGQNCTRNMFDLQWSVAMIKQTILKSQVETESHKINVLKQAWQQSENLIKSDDRLKNNSALNIEVRKLHTSIGEQMLELLTPELVQDDLLREILSLSGGNTLKEATEYFFKQSLVTLKEAVDVAKSIVYQDGLKNSAANCFYRFAQYCYDHRDRESSEETNILDKFIIRNVFLAMKYDSKEACQLFPSMLQLKSITDQRLSAYFEIHSADVPEWMFLSWIPQILSRLDFYRPCHLDTIVKKIAATYPNALVYPFNVWFEQYASEILTNLSLRGDIQEIFDSLRNPITDMFTRNIKILCLPEVLLITHLEDLMKSISQRDEIVQEHFIARIDKFINAVYVENESLQGRAYRKIIPYKNRIENLKRLNIKVNFERIHELLQNIRESTKSSLQRVDNRILLESICPWLSQYQWCGEESFLELPGQYTDDRLPKIIDHVKIVKFGQNIEVFKSLRAPFRITIYASNAKNYDFLVKHGDDLRQDQRIQQLLQLMSSKLAEDQNCRNHNLFIRTFKVFPIGRNCGLLSWVSNTLSLQNLILKALIRRDPESSRLLEETNGTYIQFIHAKHDRSRPLVPLHVYGKAAQNYNRNQLIANLRNLENVINVEILRSALIDMSVSPDSFYVLRSNFATSLAAMNVSNWILGIGDRHLLNILISTKDATLTGIDFGCVFGCGARNLPVPELIPFRLTPHLVGAMNPMGTSGVIFKCMSHVLRVLKQSKRVLMSCMEVFVQEPSVNWLSSKRVRDTGNELDSSEEWEPRERIKIAEQKLTGYNPMHLTEKDLIAGILAKYPEYLEAYLNILKGHQQFNIRAQLPEQNLTVEQQVKCLIDLATDPAVLGIAYEGFLPWL